MLESLFARFARIVVFDTETTGIDFAKDEIIELGAVSLSASGETDGMDALIRLSPGRRVPPFITELTGIRDADLEAKGWEKEAACRRFCQMLTGGGPVLMAAYNAQFDLNFLYRLLRPFGLAGALKAPHFLDALTVYRDRRPYPHKLANAIAAYGLADVGNSHRAVDDARAAAALLEAMARERDDLAQYVDLFGTHPRYGASGQKIASVTYLPQSYQPDAPLYASLPGTF